MDYGIYIYYISINTYCSSLHVASISGVLSRTPAFQDGLSDSQHFREPQGA